MWDQVLAAVRNRRRSTQVLLSGDGHIVDVRGDEVTLGFDNPNLARTFKDGYNAEPLAEALAEVLGGRWRVTLAAPGSPGAPAERTPGRGQAARAPEPVTPGFAPGDEAADDVPPDDDPGTSSGSAGSDRGAAVSGEDAAVALLQRGLGARVIEELGPDL